MKKYLFFIILTVFLGFFINFKNNYFLKINLKINNFNTEKLNSYFAEDIKDIILNLEDVKEIFIFIKPNNINLYCKLNPFKLNKNEISFKIISKINSYITTLDEDIKNNFEINIDDEYYKKYDYFLLIYGKNYIETKNISDILIDKLINKKITSKILPLGEVPRTIYVFYNDENLAQYNINLSDLVEIINKNNIVQNQTHKTFQNKNYSIRINSDFQNPENIKNINLYYINNNFSNNIGNIFEIQDTNQNPPEYLINFNNKKAMLLAICKKKFTPSFIQKIELENLIKENKKLADMELVKTSNCSKCKILLENNSSIEKSLFLSKKLNSIFEKENIKNNIYFIGIDCPKTTYSDEFLEIDKNKIVIFYNKKFENKIYKILDKNEINYLKNSNIIKKYIVFEDEDLKNLYSKIKQVKKQYSNLTTYKTNTIEYEIDDISLSDYSLNKKDIIDNIFANNEGLFCGYLYINSNKTAIIIKNKNPKDAIFSKKYKNFLYINSIAKAKAKESYYSIARKNGKYYAKLNFYK